MSKHWHPQGKIVRIVWKNPEAYGFAPKPTTRAARWLVVAGVLFAGLVGAAAWQHWSGGSRQSVDTSAIEWNTVQPVPTRTPDAEDLEWQRRATEPLVLARPEAAQQSSEGVAIGQAGGIYVIDGDTFGLGGRRIRISGIDAPEIHPPRCVQEAQLGLAAAQKLKELLSSGTVAFSGSGRDKYGRELRQVSVNGIDVAQTMIAAGLASSYEGKKRQGWC